MDRIKLTDLHCDSCLKRNIYIERESIVGEGFMCLILGLATSMILIGIPLVIAGIIKIMRGYKYRMYCADCGESVTVSREAGERIIRGERM